MGVTSTVTSKLPRTQVHFRQFMASFQRILAAYLHHFALDFPICEESVMVTDQTSQRYLPDLSQLSFGKASGFVIVLVPEAVTMS